MDTTRLRLLRNQALATPRWPDPRFPPSPYYRFLRVLAGYVKPGLSVELGLCGGGGSLHLALGWPGGTVVGVEKSEGDALQKANWDYIGRLCPNFVAWRGDSVASARDIFDRYGPVKILFVDTVHTVERTLAEHEAWLPFLDRPAYVLFDDLHRKEMAGFWGSLEGDKVRLDDLHPGSAEGGFGVWWR